MHGLHDVWYKFIIFEAKRIIWKIWKKPKTTTKSSWRPLLLSSSWSGIRVFSEQVLKLTSGIKCRGNFFMHLNSYILWIKDMQNFVNFIKLTILNYLYPRITQKKRFTHNLISCVFLLKIPGGRWCNCISYRYLWIQRKFSIALYRAGVHIKQWTRWRIEWSHLRNAAWGVCR